jgi:hypothetical protein
LLNCVNGECATTVGLGETCGGSNRCDLEVAFCGEEKTCLEALALGAICESSARCASGACAYPSPGATEKYCFPQPLMYEDCSGGQLCEPGSYCKNNVCQPQKRDGNKCGGNDECYSGNCVMGASSEACQPVNACYLTLDGL